MRYHSGVLEKALHSKKTDLSLLCMVETKTSSSKRQKVIMKEELELSQCP